MSVTTHNRSIRAFSPGSVGNIGVGFDLLGHTISAIRDEVTVTLSERLDIRILSVDGDIANVNTIPPDPEKNTAGRALLALQRGLELPFGFDVQIHKGIPLNAGLGGSAASAVAALVAANALLAAPLSAQDLIPFAVEGEFASSGSYQADNVAPMLLGGVVLAHGQRVLHFDVDPAWHAVVVHPLLELSTRDSRAVLREPYPIADIVAHGAHLAHFILGLERRNAALVRDGLHDVLVEPRRASMIPGFASVKKSAVASGALGCSISGAGPSVFAWFETEAAASTASTLMQEAFQGEGVPSETWIVPVSGIRAAEISSSRA